ncbi:MAG: Electron transport complex subunit RsxD [Dehalococcoidia bacterium]|nr:Electron transport complex subunit RsxD [Chloroflexota bacterium]
MTASFPVEMTTWVMPFAADAVTTATPLAEGFVWQYDKHALYQALFLGNIAGSIGETSALLILFGGFLLLALRIIDWRISLTYIGTVALTVVLLILVWPGVALPILTSPWENALFHILAGGLLLGAFFMATDYVTSPITARGKIIFGIGAGIITVIIRLFGGLPEGVTFAILIMNALTPLIDRYVKVRPYGLQKGVKG